MLIKASFSCSFAQDTLDCLRAVDVNSLQSANSEINASGFFGTFVFVPVVDGSFITDRPTKLLKAGKINGVRWPYLFTNWNHNDYVGVLQGSLLSVTNTFEGTTFVDQNISATVQVADYVSQLFPNFGSQEANAAAEQYEGLGTNIFQVNAIMGECEYLFLIAWYRRESSFWR